MKSGDDVKYAIPREILMKPRHRMRTPFVWCDQIQFIENEHRLRDGGEKEDHQPCDGVRALRGSTRTWKWLPWYLFTCTKARMTPTRSSTRSGSGSRRALQKSMCARTCPKEGALRRQGSEGRRWDQSRSCLAGGGVARATFQP